MNFGILYINCTHAFRTDYSIACSTSMAEHLAITWTWFGNLLNLII